MSVKIDLKGRVAIVTGGTRGIGQAIGLKFLEAGAKVILTGTKQVEINILNAENQNANIQYVQLDLSNDESVSAFLIFLSTLNQIDILINNAGINIVSDALKVQDEDYDLIQKINVEGPFKISRAVGSKMIAQKWGRIVNIASIWSVVTRPGRSVYATSKMALLGITKTFSVEWSRHNVLVNAVSPGFTVTELTLSTNTPEELKAIEATIPQQRMAQPEEIANGVLFLASNLNNYITGQNLIIDGGCTDI